MSNDKVDMSCSSPGHDLSQTSFCPSPGMNCSSPSHNVSQTPFCPSTGREQQQNILPSRSQIPRQASRLCVVLNFGACNKPRIISPSTDAAPLMGRQLRQTIPTNRLSMPTSAGELPATLAVPRSLMLRGSRASSLCLPLLYLLPASRLAWPRVHHVLSDRL